MSAMPTEDRDDRAAAGPQGAVRRPSRTEIDDGGAPRAGERALHRRPGGHRRSRRRSRATRSARTRVGVRLGHRRAAARAVGARRRARATRSITSAYSFFASAGTIANDGATPVFVDIDPRTYNLDPHRLEAAITPRTKAVVAVHLYGQCCDMTAIQAICDKHQRVADRGRGAGDRLGVGGQARRLDRRLRLLLVLPVQEPGRRRRRRHGRDAERRATPSACGCCASTARSPSTTTRWSARTRASTRCRRRSCASSCATSTAGARRARRTPRSTTSCSRARASAARTATRARATSTTSTSSACRSATGCRQHLDRARHRHRGLLPGAARTCRSASRSLGYKPGDMPHSEAAATRDAGAADLPGADGGADSLRRAVRARVRGRLDSSATGAPPPPRPEAARRVQRFSPAPAMPQRPRASGSMPWTLHDRDTLRELLRRVDEVRGLSERADAAARARPGGHGGAARRRSASWSRSSSAAIAG